MTRSIRSLAALAGLALLAFTPAALGAPGDGESIGKNLGELLSGWAIWLYAGVTALVSVVFLLNRRYNELAVWMVAAIAVGIIILSPASFSGLVEGIGDAITGGSEAKATP